MKKKVLIILGTFMIICCDQDDDYSSKIDNQNKPIEGVSLKYNKEKRDSLFINTNSEDGDGDPPKDAGNNGNKPKIDSLKI